MKINIVFNKLMQGYAEVLELTERTAEEKQIPYKTYELENMGCFGDFTFVIGGDGTLLRAAKFYSAYDVPVAGINLGRLGFLSRLSAEEFSGASKTVESGKYKTEERMMLESECGKALNDFVIKGCARHRTSKFFLEIGGKPVSDYIADGIIIATPTGSTAYGLSAGGPVVHPALDAIIIVPICPHTLNARPLVVPPDEIITVKSADKQLLVTADGMANDGEDKYVSQVTIKKAEKKAKLAFSSDDDFYGVLRNKLHWGISPCRKSL